MSTGVHVGPGPKFFHKMIAVRTDLYIYMFVGCWIEGRLVDLYTLILFRIPGRILGHHCSGVEGVPI